MKSSNSRIFILIITIFGLLWPTHASATTLSEIIEGIGSFRIPRNLDSLTFKGEINIEFEENSGNETVIQFFEAAWLSPDKWDAVYLVSGQRTEQRAGTEEIHPATDHILFSQPDFIDYLQRDWKIQYQGTALWDGEPSWQLLLNPKDAESEFPAFTLYVRKDDCAPLRSVVKLAEDSTVTTDFNWMQIDGVNVPGEFISRLDPHFGSCVDIKTEFSDQVINPDLSGYDFGRGTVNVYVEEKDLSGEEPAVYEELYHGFAQEPIIAPIHDASGTYDRVEFTFSLYVEDEAIAGELDRRHDAVTDRVIEVMSTREWTGDHGLGNPGGKYECGKELLKAIDGLLGTDKITDFYFLEFSPLKAGE